MNVVSASDSAALAGILDVAWDPSAGIVADVAEILADMRARGDAAVVDCTRRYDDENYGAARLRVPIPMLETARTLISPDVAAALELARSRIARFHERQRQPDIAYVEEDGSRYAVRRRPLRSVAVYAQRSSPACAVLMGAVPAKIAGVPRVAALTPPAGSAALGPVLFACALCGVDELYAVGGAQAIGAAAYGTESIRAVEKIVGRGAVWTTEAKRQAYGRCGIDSLAGSAEVLIVADDDANSEYVVGELLAQAERREVRRLAVLSESRPLLEAVAQLIDTLDLRTLERSELVSAAITSHCRLIAANGRDEVFEILNRFAPAYLCLQVRDATPYLEHVVAAGTVFVGDMTPLVSGEYLAGSSRFAPTSGTARFASSLSLSDFTHSITVVENSADRMTSDADLLAALAESEGLPHHAQTARLRTGS
jgi:histidinol dehydrogenase